MKQGNAAIRRKQVKQISVFRGRWPLCEFSRSVFLGVWPFLFLFIKVSTHEPKVYTNRCYWNCEKIKKGIPIIKLLVISPLFKRCALRYSGLNSFHGRLFAVEQSFLLP